LFIKEIKNNEVVKMKNCLVCNKDVERTVETMYGDICSKACFDDLCQSILGASINDFDEIETK
jgi:hypothetical protein